MNNTALDQMHFLVLNIGLAQIQGNWNYRNVCSPFSRIYYIHSGYAQIELPDRIIDLKPHHLYIIPAFTAHSYICHDSFSHYYIHIYNDSGNDVLEDFELPYEVEAGKHTLEQVKRLYELCPSMELPQYAPQVYDNRHTLEQYIIKNKQRDLYAKVESRGLLYLLVSEFLRFAQPKRYIRDERIARCIEYIRNEIFTTIELHQLAEIACLSKDHFIRLFKQEMRVTPLHYINQKKIEKAQLKLITESCTAKEIAYQLGYDDHSYFTRLFKKMTGVTPMEYRKSYYITNA
jgi:transcriptional regulator